MARSSIGNREQEDDGPTWLGLLGFVAALALLIAGAVLFIRALSTTRAEDAVSSYRQAVELCGEGNTEAHDFTNGTRTYLCEDDSQAH